MPNRAERRAAEHAARKRANKLSRRQADVIAQFLTGRDRRVRYYSHPKPTLSPNPKPAPPGSKPTAPTRKSPRDQNQIQVRQLPPSTFSSTVALANSPSCPVKIPKNTHKLWPLAFKPANRPRKKRSAWLRPSTTAPAASSVSNIWRPPSGSKATSSSPKSSQIVHPPNAASRFRPRPISSTTDPFATCRSRKAAFFARAKGTSRTRAPANHPPPARDAGPSPSHPTSTHSVSNHHIKRNWVRFSSSQSCL
jgi:hypothetical protein